MLLRYAVDKTKPKRNLNCPLLNADEYASIDCT